jgi:putative ABC transport system ATP-binding protein
MITVENVTKAFRTGNSELEVLRGVSCEIPQGSFTFIVGPSGSGKSTLLYLIGALDDPTSGEIRIEGRPLRSLTSRQRDLLRRHDLGFVFQSFNLLQNLSALDNVLVPFLPVGCPAETRGRGAELLERIGLGDRLNHRPSRLSGGEQQRLAIARAILKQPKIILADEPTGELDSRTGAVVFDLLRELNSEQGATIVVVTHDERYLRPQDLVLKIEDGRLA